MSTPTDTLTAPSVLIIFVHPPTPARIFARTGVRQAHQETRPQKGTHRRNEPATGRPVRRIASGLQRGPSFLPPPLRSHPANCRPLQDRGFSIPPFHP